MTESSLLPVRRRARGVKRRGLDLSSIAFSIAIAMWLILPSEVAIAGPLQSNGTVIRALGLLCVFLLVISRLQPRSGDATRSAATLIPVGIFMLITLVGWVMAQFMHLTPYQSAGADRAVLVALSGVGLTWGARHANLGDASRHRLFLGLSIGVAVCAGIALLQFVGILGSWSQYFLSSATQIPTDITVLGSRLGYVRASGSFRNALEFSTTLGALMPIFLHGITAGYKRRNRAWCRIALAASALAMPLALARSGLITAIASLGIYALWSRPKRSLAILGSVVVVLLGAAVALPQLTDVIFALFTGVSTDNSISGRTSDYGKALNLFNRNPWFGVGPVNAVQGAWFLDNQWLSTALSNGVLGLLGLAVLTFGGLTISWSRKNVLQLSPVANDQNRAVGAGMIALGLASTTFDVLSFSGPTFALFLLAGFFRLDRVENLSDSTRINLEGSLLTSFPKPLGKVERGARNGK